MARLILIRHSRVEAGELGPGMDWPLSSEGRNLCTPLAEALLRFQPQVIVSSPMRRAVETAELVGARLGIAARVTNGLEEHHRPFVPSDRPTGERFEDTMARFFASPSQLVFGQETADECRDRFEAAIDATLAAEPGRNVAVVSHGTVIALYAAPFFGIEAADLWKRIDWPSFIVVDPQLRRGLHLTESLSPRAKGEDPGEG